MHVVAMIIFSNYLYFESIISVVSLLKQPEMGNEHVLHTFFFEKEKTWVSWHISKFKLRIFAGADFRRYGLFIYSCVCV